MGKVLVEASKVSCSHQGSIKMTGAARLTVGDSKVLTTASVLGPAKETPFPDCSNPDDVGGPCTKILSITDGAATRLAVDGKFVVLDSLKAATDKAGGTVTVDKT